MALAYPSFRTVEPFSPYLPENLRQGLVLYLWMNEGSGDRVYDLSGNGNHGTIYGATWTGLASGKNALYFDGVDDYVRISHTPSLVPSNEWSIVAWIYYVSYREYGSIVGKSIAPGNFTYWLHIGSGDRLYSAFYSSSFPVVTSNSYIPRRTWVHVASTWTYPGKEKVYINGTLDNEATARKESINTAGDVTIAELRPGRLCLFNGIIGMVLMYNRALSDAEIRTLYELHRGLFAG